MKRALILLLTLCFFTASCGETPSNVTNDDTSAQPDTSTEEVKETITLDIEKQDFGGRVITMLTVDQYNNHFLLDMEENGDTLNDSAYKRNVAVEEHLNVDFAIEERATDAIASTLRSSVMAGDQSYDFVLPHASIGVSSMVSDGLLYDWNSLPYIDLDKPYWNQSIRDALSINGKLFLISGDICMTWQGMIGYIFNKEYLNSVKLDKDLYDTVFDGEWTIDYLSQITKNIAADLDGDGNMTEKDKYGLLEHGSLGYSIMYGCGQNITEINGEGEHELSLNTERMATIVQKYYDLVNSPDTQLDIYYSTTYPTSTYRSMILEGRSFISSYDIGGLYSYLREIEFDFGILPPAKLNEAQENYRIFCGGGFVGMPSNAAKAEELAQVIETMGYYSRQYIYPAFFDVVLENKAVRDEESYRVIQLMYENKVWDFGYNFDSTGIANNILTNVVVKGNSTDFASAYASQEATIKASFNKVIEAVKNQ